MCICSPLENRYSMLVRFRSDLTPWLTSASVGFSWFKFSFIVHVVLWLVVFTMQSWISGCWSWIYLASLIKEYTDLFRYFWIHKTSMHAISLIISRSLFSFSGKCPDCDFVVSIKCIVKVYGFYKQVHYL